MQHSLILSLLPEANVNTQQEVSPFRPRRHRIHLSPVEPMPPTSSFTHSRRTRRSGSKKKNSSARQLRGTRSGDDTSSRMGSAECVRELEPTLERCLCCPACVAWLTSYLPPCSERFSPWRPAPRERNAPEPRMTRANLRRFRRASSSSTRGHLDRTRTMCRRAEGSFGPSATSKSGASCFQGIVRTARSPEIRARARVERPSKILH